MRFLLLFLLLICAQVWGAEYTPDTVPNQRLVNSSHVSDPDALIGTESAALIDQLLVDLEQKTGAQVAVVAVESIGQAPIFDFSQALFDRWGIGSKERNDGLLILLVKDQRMVRMHTGYGLEGVLPDAVCKRIQHEFMLPAFKEGDYGGGLLSGVRVVARILSDPAQALPVAELSSRDENWFGFKVFLASFGSISLFIIFAFKAMAGHFSGSFKEDGIPQIMRWTWMSWLVAFVVVPALIVLICDQLPLVTPIQDCLLAFYAYFALLAIFQAGRQHVAVKRLLTQENYFAIGSLVTSRVSFWGWIALAFPVPFVFFYFFQRSRKKYYRNHPRKCPKCQAVMRKLDEREEDEFLSKARQMEETLGSADHDVWLCDACGAITSLTWPGTESKYEKCPSCKSLAYELESDKVLVSASYEARGKGEETRICRFCGHRKTKTYSIAKLVASSSSSGSSSSSSSSSSSGSSWGGGSSGGGGSSSSW